MPDPGLTPLSPLGGHDERIGSLRLSEVTDLALVSLAVPRNGDAAFAAALQAAYGIQPPDAGRTVRAAGGERLIWTGPEQFFLAFPHPGGMADRAVAERFGDAAYLTDQSDAWAWLAFAGPGVREALARICPLDLHPDVFGIDNAARTMMEHLGVLIICRGPDDYLLASARSSAQAFLHALQVSAYNVTGDAAPD